MAGNVIVYGTTSQPSARYAHAGLNVQATPTREARRGVKLRRMGKELKGLCPFHQDTNPSLSIDPTQWDKVRE